MPTDKTRRTIEEIYNDAEYPVAIIDSNAYIVWANKRARESHSGLFRRDGLRNAARFPAERALIGRLVRSGTGATLTPRQTEHANLRITLSPLPEIGKHMLLTAAEDPGASLSETGFQSDIVSCTAPALREIISKVCDQINYANSGDGSRAKQATDDAMGLCNELSAQIDHINWFAKLSEGGKPHITSCNTVKYFTELTTAVRRLLRNDALKFELSGDDWILMDHDMMGRVMLILVANALEHGAGEIRVEISATGGMFTLQVANGVRPGMSVSSEDAVKPFYSFTDDTEPNSRIGLGLTVAKLAAQVHNGAFSLKSDDEEFFVQIEIPSAQIERPETTQIRSSGEYFASRHSEVYLELEKYARKDSDV